MKLFVSIDNVVLRQDTSNCVIASISLHNFLEDSIELERMGAEWNLVWASIKACCCVYSEVKKTSIVKSIGGHALVV